MKAEFESIDDAHYPRLTRLAELSRAGLPLDDVLSGCSVFFSGQRGSPGGLDAFLLKELTAIYTSNLGGALYVSKLAAEQTTNESKAVLLEFMSLLYKLLDDDQNSKRCCHEALELFDDLAPEQKEQHWAFGRVSSVCNRLAWFSYLEGKFEEGLPYAKRAILAQPNNYYAVSTMGTLLFNVGEVAEAMKYLDKAMEQGVDPQPNTSLASHKDYKALVAKHRVGGLS